VSGKTQDVAPSLRRSYTAELESRDAVAPPLGRMVQSRGTNDGMAPANR